MEYEKKTLPFMQVIEQLESVMGYEDNILSLIQLISKKQFLSMRASIIEAFEVNIITTFNGKFGEEVELGDVTDAVRDVTFRLYPQSTDPKNDITYDERVAWCEAILQVMDEAAIMNW